MLKGMLSAIAWTKKRWPTPGLFHRTVHEARKEKLLLIMFNISIIPKDRLQSIIPLLELLNPETDLQLFPAASKT
jgi:hypothetical protein